MNSPIRVVCEGCLRSVEYDPVVVPAGEAACPACGRPIDGRLSTADTCVQPTPDEPADPGTPETIDWTAAWTRGTLGSLGRFQLRERLGDGGFGQVYLAFDPRLDRDVALKVLKQPEPSDRVMERFFREARAVARLDHPNIVVVHDAGYDDGRCWVAYQFVSGRPLWWYRDRQRMDPATAARIVRDLADAVNHAHGMGVVHRDIKPGNVMIDDRGRPRLIDFGLARRSDLDSDLTRDGVIVGTPLYMSPEQAVGQGRQADERSDVYSLGVIFYELLCGRRPQEILADSGEDRPGPPRRPRPLPGVRTINRAVPRRLEAICAKAMSPDPDDRYPSARVLAETIDEWLKSRKGPAHRAALGVLALILFIGLAAAAVSVPRSSPSAAAPEPRKAAGPAPVLGAAPTGPTKPVDGGKRASQPRTAPMPPPGARFVRSSKEKKYHLLSCDSAGGIHPDNRRYFSSLEEVSARNLIPCEKCNPPRAAARTPPPARDDEDSL